MRTVKKQTFKWSLLIGIVLIFLNTTLGVAQTNVTIGSGDSAVSVEGTAGGTVRATRHGITDYGVCTGWIGSNADHVVTISSAISSMTISVRSPSDTTLVILGPNGEKRCVDDGNGPNPELQGAWPAGTYQIFVGSYAENETASYRLTLTPN